MHIFLARQYADFFFICQCSHFFLTRRYIHLFSYKPIFYFIFSLFSFHTNIHIVIWQYALFLHTQISPHFIYTPKCTLIPYISMSTWFSCNPEKKGKKILHITLCTLFLYIPMCTLSLQDKKHTLLIYQCSHFFLTRQYIHLFLSTPVYTFFFLNQYAHFFLNFFFIWQYAIFLPMQMRPHFFTRQYAHFFTRKCAPFL